MQQFLVHQGPPSAGFFFGEFMNKKPQKAKSAEKTIILENQSPKDLQEGDLAIWPVRAKDGTTSEVEEVDDSPKTFLERGQTLYSDIFCRLKIDQGGLKIKDYKTAVAMSSALKRWIKNNQLQGRACFQKWPDGYRLFWVSKK